MATQNIAINENSWVKVADTAEDPVLIQKNGLGDWYVATTDTDTEPTVDYPHLLRGQEQVTRYVLGDGYIWAKNESGNAKLIVSK